MRAINDGTVKSRFFESFAEICEECKRRKFVLPWILYTLSPTGSVSVIRISESNLTHSILIEHEEAGGFRLPVTLVVIDQRNEVARVTVEVSGQKTWH